MHVLINNAGIASAGVSEAFTPEQIRDLFEVNVFGVQRVLRAVLPTLRKQGDGLVINIGSILGRVTFPFFGLYGASKYAVEALTDTYRYELSQLGIELVLVQPSAYPTSMYGSAQQPADKARSESYGEISAIPGKMFSTFMEIFQSKNAPNPHDVPEAIAKLVGQAKGSRPARVVVGEPMQYAMFLVMKEIRGLDVDRLAAALTERLSVMEDEAPAFGDIFYLHGANGKQIHRLLARMTDYVETRSGQASRYLQYSKRGESDERQTLYRRLAEQISSPSRLVSKDS